MMFSGVMSISSGVISIHTFYAMIFTNVRRIAIHVPLKGFSTDVLLCNRPNVSVIRVVSFDLS